MRWWARAGPAKARYSVCCCVSTIRKSDRYDRSHFVGRSISSSYVPLSTHTSFSDLPGLDQVDQPKRALAPGSNRRRIARAGSLWSVDCRQHPVRTGRNHGRGSDGSRRPSERPRFYQTAAERNITVNIKPNGEFTRGKTKYFPKISTN